MIAAHSSALAKPSITESAGAVESSTARCGRADGGSVARQSPSHTVAPPPPLINSSPAAATRASRAAAAAASPACRSSPAAHSHRSIRDGVSGVSAGSLDRLSAQTVAARGGATRSRCLSVSAAHIAKSGSAGSAAAAVSTSADSSSRWAVPSPASDRLRAGTRADVSRSHTGAYAG